MKILLTGCAGFIGSNVCRILIERGDSVTGVDNLDDSYDVRMKRWRLDRLAHPRLSLHEADIADITSLRPLFESGPPFDAVINLGAKAGIRESIEDPHGFYESNTTGTLNLLELCRESGVPKFVLSSTSSVYADDTPRPFREDADTSRPISPYAASKKAAETMVYAYHHLHGIDATVLRYFTVYGRAGRPDMSIFRFIRAVYEGDELTLYGDGSAERDFTYVDDVAEGTVAALRPLGFEIINLGGHRAYPMSKVISMIEECLQEKARVRRTPPHPADMDATLADIERAKCLLDWEPRVSLEEGIRRTADWYIENRSWARHLR